MKISRWNVKQRTFMRNPDGMLSKKHLGVLVLCGCLHGILHQGHLDGEVLWGTLRTFILNVEPRIFWRRSTLKMSRWNVKPRTSVWCSTVKVCRLTKKGQRQSDQYWNHFNVWCSTVRVCRLTKKGRCQSDQYWNHFKDNIGKFLRHRMARMSVFPSA